MKCSRCGYDNPADIGFCSECGATLDSGTEQSTAGQQNNYTGTVPPSYTQPNNAQPNYTQPNYTQPNYAQPNYTQPNNTQPNYTQSNYAQPMYAQPYGPISHSSRWVAFILCFFFGYLGIHRFYVGKTGTGVLYIFTGGLFTIGWLVDLIMIACGSFTDQYGAVLKQ